MSFSLSGTNYNEYILIFLFFQLYQETLSLQSARMETISGVSTTMTFVELKHSAEIPDKEEHQDSTARDAEVVGRNAT